MRMIKFRGKDMKTSNWVYGAYHKYIDITPAAFYKDAESMEKAREGIMTKTEYKKNKK